MPSLIERLLRRQNQRTQTLANQPDRLLPSGSPDVVSPDIRSSGIDLISTFQAQSEGIFPELKLGTIHQGPDHQGVTRQITIFGINTPLLQGSQVSGKAGITSREDVAKAAAVRNQFLAEGGRIIMGNVSGQEPPVKDGYRVINPYARKYGFWAGVSGSVNTGTHCVNLVLGESQPSNQPDNPSSAARVSLLVKPLTATGEVAFKIIRAHYSADRVVGAVALLGDDGKPDVYMG